MIDIRELRRDPDRFVARLARKGAQQIGRDLLQIDSAWRATTARVESLRARQKQHTGQPSELQLQELGRHKEELHRAVAELTELERRRNDLLDRVPNPPADEVPDGGEDDFTVLREVGERPSFNFPVRDHVELAEAPGWIDMTRGTKVSGSRFAYRVGDLALLELALYRYALQRAVERGHVPVLPPVLVRHEAMYGSGFFPTEAGNIYGIEREDLYLPVHLLHLVEMGMTQGQNWFLDELADACAADGRYTFLLDATPLPFTGALGSPVNPVALR